MERDRVFYWRKNICNIEHDSPSISERSHSSTFYPKAYSKVKNSHAGIASFIASYSHQPRSAWWPPTSSTTPEFKMQLDKDIPPGREVTELKNSTFCSWRSFSGPYDGHTAIITAKQLLALNLNSSLFIVRSCFLYKQSTWQTTQMFSPSPAP